MRSEPPLAAGALLFEETVISGVGDAGANVSPRLLLLTRELLAPPLDAMTAQIVLHRQAAVATDPKGPLQLLGMLAGLLPCCGGVYGAGGSAPADEMEFVVQQQNDRYTTLVQHGVADAAWRVTFPADFKVDISKHLVAAPLFRVLETRALYESVTLKSRHFTN